MKRWTFQSLAVLPLLVSAAPQATASQAAPLDGGHAVASRLEEFLGEPVLVPMQQLWKGRGGWGGILTAKDGTVVAFRSPGGGSCRRSRDGGKTWDPDIEIAPDAKGGNAIVDEARGDVLYVNPGAGWLFRSRDHGASWAREGVQVRPDGFGLAPKAGGVEAMQCGITLAFGEHKGRLLMPARITGPKSSNDVAWRPYHYSTAVYSDDGGAVWQTSKPFPVLGTGEATLAELSDGSVLYNSREHMSRGNRYFAWSHDGGDLWIHPTESPDLPDGARGTSYGCMGGMIRLPVGGRDILLYSNLDTDAGEMPSKVGASTSKGREKISVWASLDGGRTWPIKRLVYDGPSAYSNLGVGRTGTPSQGKIFLIFEGGPSDCYEAVQVVSFNLSWLLDGRDIAGIEPARPPADQPSPAPRTAWFRAAKWGVFFHYLASPASSKETSGMDSEQWNRRIDAFDVEGLARQLEAVRAGYFCITLGQNSGFYLSPNATYDRLVGHAPSRCSRRDLVADIASALKARGIPTLVYFTSMAPAHDRQAIERLRCTPPWDPGRVGFRPDSFTQQPGVDERLTDFQRNWEAVIREWSTRWGKDVCGWWIDGAYNADAMYRHKDPPNFGSFADAMRAGNPDAIVCFNPGVKVPVVKHAPCEDYTAGEIADAIPVAVNAGNWAKPVGAMVNGAQYHLLTFLGDYWGRGKPRFGEDMLLAYTRYVNDRDGVITWDVPPAESGRIPDEFYRLLLALKSATRDALRRPGRVDSTRSPGR